MNKERNELKAGVFIIITLVLAIVVVIWINGAGVGPVQARTVAYKLTDDVGGLRVGDDVRLGGFKVGTVRDIHPEGLGSADAHLLITFTLPASYVLHTDAAIGLQSSLTGAANLNIVSVGTASAPAVAAGQSLAGRTDPKTALLATLARAAPHLEDTITQLDTQTVPKVNKTVDSAQALLKHADAKVDSVTASATRAFDEASGVLGDNKSDLRGTIKNVHSISDTVAQKLPGVSEQLSELLKKTNGSLDAAQTALADIQKTAANARDLTQSLRSVIVDNHSKLDGIVNSIKTASDNIKEASIEIRHSPWRLLYKPTPAEAGNLNLYDSAREFALGAESVSDAAGSLRDALHDPRADRAQISKLLEQLDASFNHFHEVEGKLWLTAGQ
ncbi:MAG TPA: MlaD family protein [Tepidisphaeraceae bacterium]|jgi:ABC-type transporter Mla subunit MlaD|nr:MlaD family protein [Tepidisphaeraceae bacterium]